MVSGAEYLIADKNRAEYLLSARARTASLVIRFRLRLVTLPAALKAYYGVQ